LFGIFDGVERERHPGEGRDGFENLDVRLEGCIEERRHTEGEAEWQGNCNGCGEADDDAAEGVIELDANTFVIGAIVIEWVADGFPNAATDFGGGGEAASFEAGRAPGSDAEGGEPAGVVEVGLGELEPGELADLGEGARRSS
jgi:hypothetical protein